MGFKIKNGVLLKFEGAGALEKLGIRKQDENITIPKNVTSIADEAFTMTEVSRVFVPPSVASIGERAFALCAELDAVELSSGLREIGANAFDGCHILRNAVIPDTCEVIGTWAFCNCSGLRSVKISAGVDAIARGTFSGCSRLEEINVPESVRHIDNRAFYACTSLTTVNLTKGLRTIGREAFACCSSLTTIYIPETVTEIAEDAFAGCTELKTVIIPPSVTKLHPFAFGSDHHIQTITTVSGSVAHQYAQSHGIMCYTEKEAALLRGCNPAFFIEYGILKKYTQEYNVRDVMIPQGVIRIGNHAFEQNRQLVSVVVPEGVTEIGGYAFNGCRSLQRIYLPSTLKSIGRFAFRDCPLAEVILPQGIETIENNAFQGCTSIRRFYMPDTVRQLENEALRDCMSLTELRFSAALENISDAICCGCSSLRTVVIPEGPKYIQQNAFRGCSSLTEAYIPDSVIEINGNAFADTPLFRMTAGHYIVGRFLIRADGYSPIPVGVHRIGPRAFERGGLRAAIIPDGVISIGDGAFANCGVLTDVVIPKSVTEIGTDAFAYTPWMTRRTEPYTIAGANILLHSNITQPDVSVPLGVRCIGPAAFSQLPIRRVTLPEGVIHIQRGAFSYCESLEYIEIPSTLRRIDGYIFHGCTSLKTVIFRDGPSKIGHAMFSSCTALKAVKLPSTITEIDNEAFYHAGIERIIIPDGVTRIGQSAFSHCDSLTDVAIPASVTEISENAFTECPKFRLHAEPGSYAERFGKLHHMMMTVVPLNMEALLAQEQSALAIAAPIQDTQPVLPQQPALAPASDPAPQRADAPDFFFQTAAPQAAEPVERPEDAMLARMAENFERAAAEQQALAQQPEPVQTAAPDPPVQEHTVQENSPEAAAPQPARSETEQAILAAPETKILSFVEEEELNYAERVKRELEEARKKSVKVDPKAKLPQLQADDAPQPKPQKQPKQPKSKKKQKKQQELSDDERELMLRAKETPDETKARVRASLLDDLPDVDEMPRARKNSQHTEPSDDNLPDIPKVDLHDSGALSAPDIAEDEDPFADADIHWNNDQTTFTIRF